LAQGFRSSVNLQSSDQDGIPRGLGFHGTSYAVGFY